MAFRSTHSIFPLPFPASEQVIFRRLYYPVPRTVAWAMQSIQTGHRGHISGSSEERKIVFYFGMEESSGNLLFLCCCVVRCSIRVCLCRSTGETSGNNQSFAMILWLVRLCRFSSTFCKTCFPVTVTKWFMWKFSALDIGYVTYLFMTG